ncbi:hypothetical protein PT974_05889 [Cladobotryum mycophilum]|uniref:Uncharacterized protein n=1 Tax=Cladobotryum mycophilum TaxID=491253 RepID=A0ABR0SK02_9HYPO
MPFFRLGSQRVLVSLLSKSSRQANCNWPCSVRAQFKRQLNPNLRNPLQRRCYVQAPSPVAPRSNSAAQEELKKQAKSAAGGGGSGKKYEIAETLLIYHAGTGRITFLAMLKVTTLFMGAFFSFIVVPGYIKSDKSEWETAGGMSQAVPGTMS